MAQLIYTLKELIDSHFPELKLIPIRADYESKCTGGLFEYEQLKSQEYMISVSDTLKGAPACALIGGLAHELCHIIGDSRLKGLRKFFDDILYRYSKRYRANVEKQTDMMVVERGLGKELLDLLHFRIRIGLPEYDDNGLRIAELVQIQASSQGLFSKGFSHDDKSQA